MENGCLQQMLMSISDLLYGFKGKVIGGAQAREIVGRMRELKVNSANLWSISPLTRLITGTARLQAFLVIFAGLLFIPPAIYQKYYEQPQKKYRLAVYAPIAVGFVLAPLYLYRRTTRKILTRIDYCLGRNCLEVETYRGRVVEVQFKHLRVKYSAKKPLVVHELEVVEQGKEGVFKIEGYGEWQSAQLFRYLVEKGGMKADVL